MGISVLTIESHIFEYAAPMWNLQGGFAPLNMKPPTPYRYAPGMHLDIIRMSGVCGICHITMTPYEITTFVM
jgi:hypothetical protein